MQLIKITIGDNDRTALVLPIEHAGLAASLLASAKVFERDGYYSTSGWKPAEKGIQIAYGLGDEFEPTHPKVAVAEKALEQKNSEWAKEYMARQAAEKKLAETEAALAALQAATVCALVESDAKGEKCEGGSPECGPVEFHDSEGVPLCNTCWADLVADSENTPA